MAGRRRGFAALALCLGLARAQPKENDECYGVGDVHALGFNSNHFDFQDYAAVYEASDTSIKRRPITVLSKSCWRCMRPCRRAGGEGS